MLPTIASACGKSHIEMSCCKQEKKSSDSHLSCITSSETDSRHTQNCESNCNHSSCHCTTIQVNYFIPVMESDDHFYYPTISEKQKYTSVEAYLSAGFHSIWLPPKIA